MGKRFAIVIGVAAAGVMALPLTGPASAHTASFETIDQEHAIVSNAESDTGPWTTRGHGLLASKRASYRNRWKCVNGRGWRLIGFIDGTRLILDKGESSLRGHWAFGFEGDNFSEVEALTFKLLRKRIAPHRRHRHFCLGFTIRYYEQL